MVVSLLLLVGSVLSDTGQDLERRCGTTKENGKSSKPAKSATAIQVMGTDRCFTQPIPYRGVLCTCLVWFLSGKHTGQERGMGAAGATLKL